MRRDFSIELVALGKTVMGNDGKPMTLGEASIGALTANYGDEPQLTGDVKFSRYQLADRINNALAATQGLAEVTAEEIAVLKNLIGKAFTPVVVGPAYAALEQDPTPPADKEMEQGTP